MNHDQFLEILGDPHKLKTTPFEEIEILYRKYPFSKNIQIIYNKKRELLGLTQNKKPLEIIRAQHNHPVLLDALLNTGQLENYDAMNDMYDSIFEEMDESSVVPKEVTTHTLMEVEVEEPIDHKIIELDSKELQHDVIDIKGKMDSYSEAKDVKDLKNKQFEETLNPIDEPTKTISTSKNIKFIEVEDFQPKSKPDKIKSSKKKSDQKKIRKKKLSKAKVEKKSKEDSKKKKKKKSIAVKKKAKKEKKRESVLKPKKANTSKLNTSKELDYFEWLDSLKSTAEIVTNKKSDKAVTSKKNTKSVKKKKSKKTKKKGKLQNKIDKSLKRNSNIYTETLAILMEKQGHNAQAIDIYKQLMLNNPEKSDDFAARIQKLK